MVRGLNSCCSSCNLKNNCTLQGAQICRWVLVKMGTGWYQWVRICNTGGGGMQGAAAVQKNTKYVKDPGVPKNGITIAPGTDLGLIDQIVNWSKQNPLLAAGAAGLLIYFLFVK
jgi:hypothetical protein